MRPRSRVLWGCDSASITSIASKWRPFRSSVGKTEKNRIGDGDDMLLLVNNSLMKGSVRRCVVAMQQPVLLSSKFGVKSSHIFMRIWCYSFVGSITKSLHSRCRTWNKRMWTISTSTQLHQTLYADSQDVLVLLFTVALRYYSCCTDGSTSPGNYGLYFCSFVN
jgi:hypothetical protein